MSSQFTNSQGGNKDLFTLDTFSHDFVLQDFIESLTETAIQTSGRAGLPSSQSQSVFDPKPLIRSFESSLAQLSNLSNILDSKEAELHANVRKAEAQHNQIISSVKLRLSEAVDRYNELESSLNAVSGELHSPEVPRDGRNAVRIGEKLEEVDRQRQRAMDAKFLVQCWVEVSTRGNLASLENMQRVGGSEGKVRCAHIARQLLRICSQLEEQQERHALDPALRSSSDPNRPGFAYSPSSCRGVIDKFLEKLEKDLLSQFDEHRKVQNFTRMRECARALRDFNDGASVMTAFINQHDFFIRRDQVLQAQEVGDEELWERLAEPEPNGDYNLVEPSLQSLVDEAKYVLQEEAIIIKKAFPYPDEMMARFIQRIFQQSIQQRLESVLETANNISSLVFLRSLQTARNYIGSMVEALKVHGLIDHPDPASTNISLMLDQQLEELFIPYLNGSFYIEREKKSLEDLFQALLFKFMTYHSRRKKTTAGYLAAFSRKSQDFVSSTRDVFFERLSAPDMPATQRAVLSHVAGLSNFDPGKRTEIAVTEIDGELRIDVCKRMFQWLAESVGRCLELSPNTETPKDVQALVSLFLTHTGEVYIETALDTIHDTIQPRGSSKTPPDLSFFPSLRSAMTILYLLQSTLKGMLLPLTSSNLPVYRQIASSIAASSNQLESQLSTILHEIVDAVLSHTTHLLSYQDKADFRPREDSITPTSLSLETPTCNSVITYLHAVGSKAEDLLDGHNTSLFFSELAIGIRAVLLEHLKKFVITRQGGLIVSQDVNKYMGLVEKWPIEETSEFAQTGKMSILLEIARLFVITPDALWDRLRPSKNSPSTNGPSSSTSGPEKFSFPPDKDDLSEAEHRSPLPISAIARPDFPSSSTLPTLTSTALALGRPISLVSPATSVFPLHTPMPSPAPPPRPSQNGPPEGISAPPALALKTPLSPSGDSIFSAPLSAFFFPGLTSPPVMFPGASRLSFMSNRNDGDTLTAPPSAVPNRSASPAQPWEKLTDLRSFVEKREDAGTPAVQKVISSL